MPQTSREKQLEDIYTNLDNLIQTYNKLQDQYSVIRRKKNSNDDVVLILEMLDNTDIEHVLTIEYFGAYTKTARCLRMDSAMLLVITKIMDSLHKINEIKMSYKEETHKW